MVSKALKINIYGLRGELDKNEKKTFQGIVLGYFEFRSR